MNSVKTLTEPPSTYRKAVSISSPASGRTAGLDATSCVLTRHEVWGPGCAVNTMSPKVTSPFNGTVTDVSPLDYAVTIKASFGLICRIKFGDNTTHLHGERFVCSLTIGEKVVSGQTLFSVNNGWLKQQGVLPLCIVTVTNAKRILGVVPSSQKHVNANVDPIFTVYV